MATRPGAAVSRSWLVRPAAILIVLAATLVPPGPSRAQNSGPYDHLAGSRGITEFSGRVHFYYQRDTADSFKGVQFLGQEGLEADNYEEVEVSGSVRFTGSGSRYRCQGNLSYSVKTYMESSLGEFKQVQINDGRGSAPVHRGLLEIDREAGQERNGTQDPSAGLAVSHEQPRVFLVKPGDGGRSGKVVAGGDSLVPVDIPDEGLLFLSPEEEEVEREDRESAGRGSSGSMSDTPSGRVRITNHPNGSSQPDWWHRRRAANSGRSSTRSRT